MKRVYVLLVATLVTGCSVFSSTETPTAMLPPTAETPSSVPEPTDPTQLITVRAGETFDLVLPSNPTTGYQWRIVPEAEAGLVELISQTYIPDQPTAVGSSGVDLWTFRALNPGDTTIVLGYYPPGNETQPEEEVTFSVRVE